MSVRLFAARDSDDPSVARLDAAAARHLRARRVSPGDSIVLVLDPGREHDAVVLRIDGGGATCRVGDGRPANTADPAREVWLCLGLADATRLDLVVEKATELGASALALFRARRSQLPSVPGSRLERWRRLAIAACEQCGRTRPPAIEAGWSLDDVAALVARASEAIVFVAPRAQDGATRAHAASATVSPGDPAGRGRPDSTRGAARAGPAAGDAPLVLVVGPEGGLDDDEVRRLLRAGARPASLGPRVLRFETAAIAALARHAPDAGGVPIGVPADPLE